MYVYIYVEREIVDIMFRCSIYLTHNLCQSMMFDIQT